MPSAARVARLSKTETILNLARGDMPANWDCAGVGDSRTEDGLATNYTTSGGYVVSYSSKGFHALIATATGGRLIPGQIANFGISGGTAGQAAFDPRKASSTYGETVTPGAFYRGSQGGTTGAPTGSGSSNKGFSYAKAHDAQVILLLLGTNADTADYAATPGYIQAFLNGLGKSKLVILLNETPKGIILDGTVSPSNTVSAAFKAYSDILNTFDYASGHGNARSNVLVIDTWPEFLNAASGTSYYNKVGYLRDGLHFAFYGSLRAAELIHARLTAVYGSAYTNLPSRVLLPSGNALAGTQAARNANLPWLTSNPNMTPGGNGTVSGTYGTPPLASGIPQGWTLLAGTNANVATVTCTKGGTDAQGFNEWVVSISGTVPALSTIVATASQTIPYGSYVTDGSFTVGDRIRAAARCKIDTGSVGAGGCGVELVAFGSPNSALQDFSNGIASSPNLGYVNDGTNDGGGRTFLWQTEEMDLSNPNFPSLTSISFFIIKVAFYLVNNTTSPLACNATYRVSAAGIYRAGA